MPVPIMDIGVLILFIKSCCGKDSRIQLTQPVTLVNFFIQYINHCR